VTEVTVEVDITCVLCGRVTHTRYSGCGERMRRDLHCFYCVFWQELIEQDAGEPENVVIVDGRHYLVRADLEPGKDKWLAGFGGGEFRIVFNDGRSVVSHNLWHQGEIPDRFRAALPDNASWETD
jgi:hypothetical protein